MHYLDLISYGYARLKAYPTEIFIVFIERVFSLVFLMIFWSLVIENSDTDITIKETLSYFMIIQGISMLFFIRSQKFGSMLRKHIKSGEISNYLTKPLNVILSMYATTLGEKSIEGFTAIILIIAGVMLDPPGSFVAIPLFLVFLIFAGILGFTFNLFEGVMTFYTTEPGGIMNMMSHISSVFSGFWIPLMFFPATLRKIVELSPFPWMLYGPYQSLQYTSFDADVARSMAIAAFWAFFLTGLMIYLWNKGLKQYEAIGI